MARARVRVGERVSVSVMARARVRVGERVSVSVMARARVRVGVRVRAEAHQHVLAKLCDVRCGHKALSSGGLRQPG